MKKFRSESDYLHAAFSARSRYVRVAPYQGSLIPCVNHQPVERPQGLEFGYLQGLGRCRQSDAPRAAAGAMPTLGPAGSVAGANATGSDPLTPSQRHP